MRAWTRVGHFINELIIGTEIINGCNEVKHPNVPNGLAKSWLDVGSGNGEACTTMELNRIMMNKKKVSVDPKAWVNDLELLDPPEETDWLKYRMPYDENCPVYNDHFDIVSCLDCIEHVEKVEGEKWLDHFEEIADRLIIIFTPDGFLPQGPEQDDKFDELELHRSGWEAEDFLKRGYCVYRTPKDFHHNPSGLEGDWGSLLAWKNKAI